jgi:UDP-glucose 4-epimerase
MAKFLVTGGCGFIGLHLVEHLIGSGHAVRVLDTARASAKPFGAACEFLQGDVRDPQRVEQAMRGVDGCFHLAAAVPSQKAEAHKPQDHEVNVGGMINVLNAAARANRAAPPRVVYASSALVYGDNASVPLTESDALHPLCAYGADKATCELEARIATLQYGIPTVGLRLFTVYGSRQRRDSLYGRDLESLLDMLRQRRNAEHNADNHELSDWIYVADTLPFFVAAMNFACSRAEIFNVCSGKALAREDLWRLLASLTGSPLTAWPGTRGGRTVQCGPGDPSRAQRLLGVAARTTLAAGLRETLQDRAVWQASLSTPRLPPPSRIDCDNAIPRRSASTC